jgi:hypothetical protein
MNPPSASPAWRFSEDELHELTKGACQEAMALARQILKYWWLEAILHQVVEQLKPASATVCYLYGITYAGRAVNGPADLVGVPYRKLQALLRHVPAEQYGAEVLRKQLADPQVFRSHLEAHHRMLASLQIDGPLLPLRFGTICPDVPRVQAFLEAHYEDFCATLALLEGRQEWTFRLFVDRPRLLETIRLANPSATDTQALEEEADRLVQLAAHHCHEKLQAAAERATPLVPQLRQRQVMRTAYLVAQDQTEAFRHTFENLERAYRLLGFQLQLEGPSPPFNFVRLRLEKESEPAAVSL